MSCQFCKGKLKLVNNPLRHEMDFQASIIESEMVVHVLSSDGLGRYPDSFTDLHIPMLFCPICGDKLEEK